MWQAGRAAVALATFPGIVGVATDSSTTMNESERDEDAKPRVDGVDAFMRVCTAGEREKLCRIEHHLGEAEKPVRAEKGL